MVLAGLKVVPREFSGYPPGHNDNEPSVLSLERSKGSMPLQLKCAHFILSDS